MNNSIIKETIRKFYNKHSEAYYNKFGSLSLYNDSYDYLINKIQDCSSILELACGPGNVSYYIKNHKPDLTVTGVDISIDMIEIAKKRIPDGKFIVKDICKLKIKTDFDCVICAFGIPYLNSAEVNITFYKIAQSLKAKGYFYVSFISGKKQGFEKTSLSDDDKLFIYCHQPQKISEILSQHSLSVLKEIVIDCPEMDGAITKEIIYIGKKI